MANGRRWLDHQGERVAVQERWQNEWHDIEYKEQWQKSSRALKGLQGLLCHCKARRQPMKRCLRKLGQGNAEISWRTVSRNYENNWRYLYMWVLLCSKWLSKRAMKLVKRFLKSFGKKKKSCEKPAGQGGMPQWKGLVELARRCQGHKSGKYTC